MERSRQGPRTGGAQDVTARVERLADAAERRWRLDVELHRERGLDAEAPVSPAAARGSRERARELHDHIRSFLLPRARDLDAPLLVVIVGPTGSGKSSLLNTLAGAPLSRTGVLRPTTRDAVAVGDAAGLASLTDGGALAAIPPERLERHDAGGLPSLVIVDAPDVDSVEHADRALSDHLVEAADLGLFVTTATRYADRVPWDVLQRAEQRQLELIVVLNRMPAGPDGSVVLRDLMTLLAATRLRVREVVTVPEGALGDDGASLAAGTVEPVRRLLGQLSADATERRAVAAAALAGALGGIEPLVRDVAEDLDREVRVQRRLLDHAREAYADETALMLERLFSGTFLREEVVRHWHSFVGADQVTRFFARGIGGARATLSGALRRSPRAPVAAIQRGASDDIVALVTRHAAEAARRTSEHWSADPEGTTLLATHPELWSCSRALDDATRTAVEDWVGTIAQDVAARGAGRRGAARLAALGVNGVAVTLMLVTFASTGGITGAEAGIAAATAYLNQKLLNALFGEAAVQEMISQARRRLSTALEQLLAAEQARFEERAGDVAARERLAEDLRAITD